MFKINFLLNDEFLASHTISNFRKSRFIDYAIDEYKQDILDLQNLAWKKSEDLYAIVSGQNPIYFDIPISKNYKEISNNLINFISELIITNEFKKLKLQTEESIGECKKEWELNFEFINKYLLDLGIDLSGEFNIYMVHPGLKAGTHINHNNICWSHQTYWPNYNTVYITHEILHSYFNKTESEHALIELITDDHMRSILNGDKYPPFVGHDFLSEFKVKVNPLWQNYLESENKNIKNLVAEFKSAHEAFIAKK